MGIAAKSLKELLAKSCEKFDVRFYFQKKSISIHKIRIIIERLMRVGNYLNLGIAQFNMTFSTSVIPLSTYAAFVKKKKKSTTTLKF